jgi:hypothetical protein
MELTPAHLQPDYLDPHPLFQSDAVTLWYIDSRHPDVVDDDYVSARLATTTIWSLDTDRTYALLVLHATNTWSDEAITALLRYIATDLHGSDSDVTDTFSVEVFAASTVTSPTGRGVWWREDYIDDPPE